MFLLSEQWLFVALKTEKRLSLSKRVKSLATLSRT